MLMWAYLGILALCLVHLGMSALPSSRRATVRSLAVVLAALVLSLWADAPSQLTDAARHFARLQGWYEARRPYQADVIGVLLLMMIGALGLQLSYWRQRGGWLTLAMLALTGLVAFLGVRTVSLHQLDSLLARTAFGHPLGSVLEGSLLAVLAGGVAGSALSTAQRRSGQGPSHKMHAKIARD